MICQKKKLLILWYSLEIDRIAVLGLSKAHHGEPRAVQRRAGGQAGYGLAGWRGETDHGYIIYEQGVAVARVDKIGGRWNGLHGVCGQGVPV